MKISDKVVPVAVKRLLAALDAIDLATAELENLVQAGDVDEQVLIELELAKNGLSQALKL